MSLLHHFYRWFTLVDGVELLMMGNLLVVIHAT